MRRTALGGILAVAGLAATGVDALADTPARSPLVAPRPVVRVTISSPVPHPLAVERRMGDFLEPARDASAKPDNLGAPEALLSLVGRTGPALASPQRVDPATADNPTAVVEPTRLADPGRVSVRRIELAPPVERSEVVPGPAGEEARIVLGDAPTDSLGARRIAGELKAVPSTAVDAADVIDGPAVPGDPLAMDVPEQELVVKPVDPLATACDEAIRIASARLLTGESRNARSNSPWQIGHGLMALREDYVLIADGRQVRALDWIASGPKFKNEPWFVRGRFGPKAHEYSGTMYDFEGHPNQILAFLAMSDLPQDFVLRDGDGRPFTIAEWIETAKREVRINRTEEVTWTLWAFSVYLDSDAQWVNARREGWSMSRLVEEELKSDPTKHACGGTHGLYALASARNARLQEGNRLRGQWLLAHEKVSRYTALARSLQNPDGSFSDKYFQGRSHQRDLVTRIGSSGHTLEFLMMALPQSELDSAWVRAGVGRVATDLLAGRNAEVGGKAVGGMYHAVHALKLYRERTGEDFTPVRLQTAEGPRRVIR
ncbi:hypothetical protein [Alienimonas chondri]|uniref:hypothetical protein n=1 Tax=Alienimonas chondri TaxID=2681879 RepID=UPI001487F05B|nr:hypothetical protein [Alienimonas chondri]